jgi:hypothetical protein
VESLPYWVDKSEGKEIVVTMIGIDSIKIPSQTVTKFIANRVQLFLYSFLIDTKTAARNSKSKINKGGLLYAGRIVHESNNIIIRYFFLDDAK